MNDRYIIVCRDGYVSYPFPKLVADRLLASWLKTHHGKTRPAYRIRIREKARPAPLWNDFCRDLLEKQEPLGAQFQAVWDANLTKLYEP